MDEQASQTVYTWATPAAPAAGHSELPPQPGERLCLLWVLANSLAALVNWGLGYVTQWPLHPATGGQTPGLFATILFGLFDSALQGYDGGADG